MNGARNNKTLVIVMAIFSLVVIGMLGYKLFFSDSKDNNQGKECNCSNCGSSNNGQNSLSNTSGKIVVKRKGVAKLESVPIDVIGKYENNVGDYYKLNSDGTAEINVNGGCSDCTSDVIKSSEATFQLSYVDDERLIVEFYINSSTHASVPGGFLFGDKSSGKYRFMVTDNTPSSNACDQSNMFEKK